MILARSTSNPDGDAALEIVSDDTGARIRIVQHAGERHAWLTILGGLPREIPADRQSIQNHLGRL
jgi:hypothetical protein